MTTNPDNNGYTIVSKVNIPLILTAMEYDFIKQLNEKMADKVVNEVWKKHGQSLLKKVDKKTIGNITVKKLSTMIAQELNNK